jgi:hypothetical protein
MRDKLQADLTSIGLSFLRAFVATMTIGNVTNVSDIRGWRTFLTAAAVAGVAAALRTAQTLLAADTTPTE